MCGRGGADRRKRAIEPGILTAVTPKLYKAGEVCELLQVQPYVLRSWEKEFPGIGVQAKSPDSPRLYRQIDLEHVQKIKQLVFGEGLTVAGARRKLEAEAPPMAAVSVRKRLAVVREGLRELQSLLSNAPSSNGHGQATRRAAKRAVAKRSAAPKRGAVRNVKASATRKKKATRKH